MRIQRYPYGRRNRGLSLGCGCGVLLVFVGVLACIGIYAFSSTPLLTGIALDLAGADRIGRTDALFESNIAPESRSVSVAGGTSAGRVTLSLGSYGQQTVDVGLQGVSVVTGTGSTGAAMAQADFTENGLLQLCNQRGNICRDGDSRYRDIVIDLRPGGAVIYADVNAGVWQRIGVVIRLNPTGTRFDVVGVDVGGVLYDPNSLPGELSTFTREIERVGNDALRQMVLDAAGGRYSLESMTIDEATLTVILR